MEGVATTSQSSRGSGSCPYKPTEHSNQRKPIKSWGPAFIASPSYAVHKFCQALFPRQERETDRGQNANEGHGMVPADLFAQIKNGEAPEDTQGDDFLQNLELGCAIVAVAPAIGRYLQDVFEEGDAPTGQDHDEQRRAAVSQVAVPSHRHENIRGNQ